MLSCANYEVLLQYRNGPISVGPGGLSERERYLLKQQYIEPCEFRSYSTEGVTVIAEATAYRITIDGEDALAEYEQAQADRKTERKYQRAMIISTLLGAMAGSALTLLVEHFDVVLKVLASLFS